MSEILSIQRAVVIDNNDPEARSRVLTTIPRALGTTVPSAWCEPVIPVQEPPRVGEIIYIHFANGDPAKPVYYPRTAHTVLELDAILAELINTPGSAVANAVSALIAAAVAPQGD